MDLARAPKPWEPESGPFGTKYSGLIQAIVEAEDSSGQSLAELAFTIFLLNYNYCLSPSDYDCLLGFTSESAESIAARIAFHRIAQEHLQSFVNSRGGSWGNRIGRIGAGEDFSRSRVASKTRAVRLVVRWFAKLLGNGGRKPDFWKVTVLAPCPSAGPAFLGTFAPIRHLWRGLPDGHSRPDCRLRLNFWEIGGSIRSSGCYSIGARIVHRQGGCVNPARWPSGRDQPLVSEAAIPHDRSTVDEDRSASRDLSGRAPRGAGSGGDSGRC